MATFIQRRGKQNKIKNNILTDFNEKKSKVNLEILSGDDQNIHIWLVQYLVCLSLVTFKLLKAYLFYSVTSLL